MRDIQVFLGFGNFYRQFIQGFSKIAAPLTSMLRITATLSSPKSSSKATEKAREEAGNKFGDGIEIGRVKLTKAKKSKKLA